MNDFELSYMHHARSSELLAEAEQERRAKAQRGSLASRLGKTMRRSRKGTSRKARRPQPTK